jgi:hypothetical protein
LVFQPGWSRWAHCLQKRAAGGHLGGACLCGKREEHQEGCPPFLAWTTLSSHHLSSFSVLLLNFV